MISFYSLNKLQSEKREKYRYSKSNLNSQKTTTTKNPKRNKKSPTKKTQSKEGFIRKLLTIRSIHPKKDSADLLKTHVSATTLT